MRNINMLYYTFSFLLLLVIPCFGKPNVQFNELSYDFGKVKQETKLKHIFTFKNTGSSTLTIEKISAGWGCTGVLLSRKDIPAGGDGEIEITLETGTNKGKIIKSIYVYTNDKNNIKVTLKVEAIVFSKEK